MIIDVNNVQLVLMILSSDEIKSIDSYDEVDRVSEIQFIIVRTYYYVQYCTVQYCSCTMFGTFYEKLKRFYIVSLILALTCYFFFTAALIDCSGNR
jgi:hypothetical protein